MIGPPKQRYQLISSAQAPNGFQPCQAATQADAARDLVESAAKGGAKGSWANKFSWSDENWEVGFVVKFGNCNLSFCVFCLWLYSGFPSKAGPKTYETSEISETTWTNHQENVLLH